jgi:ACDE family multidrug resistance protein
VTTPAPPEPASEQAGPRPPLAIIFAITLTGILANTIVNPAIPDLLDDLDQSSSSAGLFVGIGALPGVLMAPLIGVLSDRFGRRQVVLPCLVGFGVFGLLGALAPSFGVLLALRLVQGVASAGLINLAVVIIGDHWDGLARAKAIGQNAAALTVALAVFPALGGVLAGTWGWEASFLPYGFGLVTAVAVARVLPKGRPTVGAGRTVRQQVSEAWVVIKQPLVLAVTALGFVVFFVIFGLFLTVLPVHLDEDLGVGATGRGLVLAVPAITSTVVALNLGRLRARFGGRVLVLAGTVVYAVGFVAIGLAPSVAVLVVAALFYGLAEGFTIPTLQDVAAGSGPAETRGSVVAVWVGVVRAGQFVGPLLAGASIAWIGSSATLVVGGLLTGVIAIAQVVGRPLVSRRPAAL